MIYTQEFQERVLVQLTKSRKLLYEEGYNDTVIKPIESLIKELRQELNVHMVSNDKVKIKYAKESK